MRDVIETEWPDLASEAIAAQRLTPRLAAAAVDSPISAAMSRVARAAAPAAEPSYPVWKAKAVKALQRLHERAAAVKGERIWTRAYIMQLSPAEAAEVMESSLCALAETRPVGT